MTPDEPASLPLPPWARAARDLPEGLLVHTVFQLEGDPVALLLEPEENGIRVSDAQAVSGTLFSTGQHLEGDPGYELVMKVAESHRVRVDRDEGTLTALARGPEDLEETMAGVVQTVLALLITIPHLAGVGWRAGGRTR